VSGRLLVAAVLGLVLLGPGAAEAAKVRTRYAGVVNLNEATVAQLSLLPGVGEKAAERILAHRQKRTFKRIEELVRVKGFGKKKFLRLKPYLAVQGETTLRVEKVAEEEDEAPPPGKPAAKH
jgi:competence protein ComEA